MGFGGKCQSKAKVKGNGLKEEDERVKYPDGKRKGRGRKKQNM